MSELEQLIQQRKEIQRRIQEIKKKGVLRVGNVKIDKEEWGCSGERWFVAIETERFKVRDDLPKKVTWQAIVNKQSREDAIKEIPEIIKNLQALYDKEVSGGQESDSSRVD